MNRLEGLKRTISVALVLYREDIRKKMIKLMIFLNFLFFIMSVGQNIVSMFIFILNMHYLYNYLKKEYPEESIKVKDRFKGM